MAEYVAGRGTTALGIIGTILGGIGTAFASNGANGIFGNGNGTFNNTNYATKSDIESTYIIAQKDSQIAKLESEKSTDTKILEVYKYFDGELKDLRENQSSKWTEQAIINANFQGSIGAVSMQVSNAQSLLAQITSAVVPQNKVCDICCCKTSSSTTTSTTATTA
jgi:hypothetical protein